MFTSALLIAALFAQTGAGVGSDRGIVTGRIVSPNGNPAQGVRVIATSAPDPTGRTNGVTIVVSIAQSDDDGRFVLENIPPGSYYISAGQLEVPTYYPGVVKEGAATVLNVAPRSTTSGIDFKLLVPPAARVRGRVVLAPGASIPSGTKVRLFGGSASNTVISVGTPASIISSPNGTLTTLLNIGSTASITVVSPQLIADIASDGSFEIPKVRPGNYEIGFSQSVPFFHPQSVLIAEENVNLEIGIPATTQIVAGAVALEGAEVGELPPFTLQFSGLYNATGKVPSSGGFQVALPDGDYTLKPSGLPQGYSIKSLRAGTVDLLAEPFRVKAGETAQRVTATVGVALSSVSGRVIGIDTAIGGATGVMLTGGPAKASKETGMKGDGSFDFPQLPPGLYELNLVGPAPVLASYLLKPVIVDVKDRNVTGVEIRVGRRRALNGKVSIEPPGALMPIFVLSLENGSSVTTVPVKPEGNGNFTVFIPEGEWRTEIHGLALGYSSTAFTYGETDLVKGPLRVSGITPTELRIALNVSTEALSKVRGRLTGVDSMEKVKVLLSGSVIASDLEGSVLPDGSFEFSGVPEGLYTVRAAGGASATTPLSTAAGVDLEGVELNIPRAIPGRFVVEGVNRPQAMAATIAVYGGEKDLTFSGPVAEGPFVLSLTEGEQTISIQDLTGGYQVQSMNYGSNNLLTNPLIVSGPPTAEIVVTIVTTPPIR